ncbi:hypothetical protein [Sulfurimonas sp. HSL-1716]|uniref:hypothetical protein n=1 Tax=Hydrocurvibacter sulfurireducens TaxID=3131937 RepID=UPI0031FA328C
MNITRYIFESPYSSQIQIGRPDPSVKQQASSQQQGSELLQNTNQTTSDAQTFLSTEKKDVTPTVTSTNLLDTYA